MPIHIEAKPEDISKVVLLPGDPQRAEYIAKKFLTDVKKYTEYRLMYGFTGFYKGKNISIQTTGMGSPSISIIIEELNMLGAKTLIRVGTCGAINDEVGLSDLILATDSHSSHNIYHTHFNSACFSAGADFLLTKNIYDNAINKNFRVHCGSILTSEVFYEDSFEQYKKFAKYGTLAVEMESYPLFLLSKKYGIKASTVLTVSDIVFESKRGDKEQIKKGVDKMTELVLDTIIENYQYLTD